MLASFASDLTRPQLNSGVSPQRPSADEKTIAVTEWIHQTWSYLLLWAGFLGAVIVAIRAVYAAERDREALDRVVYSSPIISSS